MKKYFKLSKLLSSLEISVPNIMFKEMKLDSRKVEKNDIFLAVPGSKKDGRDYIDHAIKKGASAVIAESYISNKKDGYIDFTRNIPVVLIKDLNKKMISLSENLYKIPKKAIKLIGVTGTNGKTTVAHIIAQLANLLGDKSAVMGTVGNGLIGENIISNGLTTASCIEIRSILQKFFKKNVKIVAMEVSSHGLAQGRTSNLSFSSAIFTNLTRDHLDFHKNIENYKLAKKKLFYEYSCKNRIFYVDDPVGYEWMRDFPDSCAVSTNCKNLPKIYGRSLYVKKITYLKDRTVIHFSSDWGDGEIKTSFLGDFNVSNFALAIASLLMMGYPIRSLIKNTEKVLPIVGRMQIISHRNPRIIIDYSHNPDSLRKCLVSLRKHFKSKIWCIFGCGGDRDKGKRSIMGEVAVRYSDFVIITNDNPRSEEPKKIFEDILKGCVNLNFVRCIPDRTEAIRYAIFQSKPNDTVIISGKGHEVKQIMRDHQTFCSDHQIALNWLSRK